MSVKKLKLTNDFHSNYYIIGIGCNHLKDYMLASGLNKYLNINLIKLPDFSDNSKDEISEFSLFISKKDNVYGDFILLSNKNDNVYLINKTKQLDYFIILKDSFPKNVVNSIIQKVRKSQKINYISIIPDKLHREFNTIFFDLEMHINEVERR